MAIDRRRIAHKRDRLRQLRAFCNVARLGSFSRAAEYEGVSQPAVSLQVRELEYELEEPLFDRARRGVRLTAAGEQLHALAAPIVEGMGALLADFAEQLEDDVSGRVDLAATVAGADFVLPWYVKRFSERYPGVCVRVRNCPLGEGMALLRAGEVEFVVRAREPLEDHALQYREMLRYNIVLITARDHPLAGRATVTPQEVAEGPVVVPLAGSYGRKLAESAAREFGVEIEAVIEVGGWGVIKRYVERGLGICMVPSICVRDNDPLSVISLENYFAPRSYGVYTRRGKALTAAARRLLELLIPGFA